MAASLSGRLKEVIKKYGKVALGVHCTVSAATVTGLYVAIKNNADVASIFNKLPLPGIPKEPTEPASPPAIPGGPGPENKERNRTADLAASGGGALALAILFNKALIPVRIPITIALTPPIARFLARRRIIKDIAR